VGGGGALALMASLDRIENDKLEVWGGAGALGEDEACCCIEGLAGEGEVDQPAEEARGLVA